LSAVFFFQAEDGIRDRDVTGVQTCALPIWADSGSFIAGFAGDDRYIVDYLVEEVLQRLPETTRQFLLDTAILERLTGELCDTVRSEERRVGKECRTRWRANRGKRKGRAVSAPPSRSSPTFYLALRLPRLVPSPIDLASVRRCSA